MSKIISGKEIAQDLRNKLKQEISDLKNKTGKCSRVGCGSSW